VEKNPGSAGHPIARTAAQNGFNEVDQLSQVNIALAMDRIRDTLGEERLGAVTIVGMFFRIEDGTLFVLRDDEFVSLTDSELHGLAHLSE
jgi:carbonic anhydrase